MKSPDVFFVFSIERFVFFPNSVSLEGFFKRYQKSPTVTRQGGRGDGRGRAGEERGRCRTSAPKRSTCHVPLCLWSDSDRRALKMLKTHCV